jgi:hypothetical protein
MKHLLLAVCVLCTVQLFAQNGGDEPPSRDDVILYLRTIHSHDMVQRIHGSARTIDADLVQRHGHEGEGSGAAGF